MLKLHPEFVVNEKQQKKAVLLPIKEWQKLVEACEELEDIKAYDKAKSCPSDSMPFEQAVREIREGKRS